MNTLLNEKLEIDNILIKFVFCGKNILCRKCVFYRGDIRCFYLKEKNLIGLCDNRINDLKCIYEATT